MAIGVSASGGGSAHENILLDPDVPYTTYIQLYKSQKKDSEF